MALQWCRYDRGTKGHIDLGDLRMVLHTLGLLANVRDKEQYVAAQMLLADKSGSGTLSFDEFCNYYTSLRFAGMLPLLVTVHQGQPHSEC